MKNLLLLALLATIYACSHPIEIVGEGDVLSATGTRNCYLEDFQAKKENCTKNLVQGAYNETYYAVSRPGWEFDKWINYCADAVSNECAFVIPADAVQNNWGTTVPALVAVFNRLPVTPPVQPPTFPTVDQDGNVSFATAKIVSDQSVTNETVSSSKDADYFKFTAEETAYYSVALEFSKPDISLYWYNDDANATLVGESRTSGATKQIVEGKRLEQGKTYVIGVQAIAQTASQNYKLTISRGAVIPTGPVIFNDGGSHVVNYSIDTGIRVENSTTVIIESGATISGPESAAIIVTEESHIIVNGGHIQGTLSLVRTGAEIHGGTINSVSVELNYYRSLHITGGSIESLSAGFAYGINITGGNIVNTALGESVADISGGTFGRVSVSSEVELTIIGGNFKDEVSLRGHSIAFIKGGTFMSHFSAGEDIRFYGELSRTDAEPTTEGSFPYLVRVSGTLADGSTINSYVNCGVEPSTGIPCGGVEIRE